MSMKPTDKARVDRFRKAFPEESVGKKDKEILAIIKGMGKTRHEFQRNFAKAIKTYG